MCHPPKKGELPVANIEPMQVIEDFGRDIYFQDIVDIEKINSRFLFLDGVGNRVFCTNEHFAYLFSFIEEGGAENEAKGLQSMAVFRDTIYVADVSAGKIMTFDVSGGFIESYPSLLLGIGDFAVGQNNIIVYNDNNMLSEELILLNKHQLTRQHMPLVSSGYNKPDRHILLLDEGDVLCVFAENKPIIEIYSQEGKLLSHTDLSYLDIFKPVMAYYEEEIKHDPKTDLVLIPDASICNNHLFLLVTHMDENSEWHSRYILECQITQNVITPIKLILPKEGWYESVYVDCNNGYIVLGNTADVLIAKFSLP